MNNSESSVNHHMSVRSIITLLLTLIAVVCFVVLSAFVVNASETTDITSDAVVYGTPEVGEYIQVAYDDTNGLLTSEANTILYSRDGYIWIGSYSGLTRYDSQNFTTYGTIDNSLLKGVSIRTLFEDSNGRVWIGSNDSGLYMWENGNFHKIETASCGVSNSIRDIIESKDKKIIIATTAGIAVIQDSPIVNKKVNDVSFSVRALTIESLAETPVNALLCDSNGNIWAISSKDVLSFSITEDNQDILNYSLSSAWSRFSSLDYECNCIFETPDNRLLIGTAASELIEMTPNGEYSYSVRTLITGNCYTINCILADSYGRIWLCSDTGIGYLNGNQVIYAGDMKCSSSVVDMTEDYEGNLWFASSRDGIMKLVRGKFTSINASSGLTGTTINATLIYDGYLFAATDNGLIALDAATYKQVSHPLTTLLKGIRIRSLMADSKGNLWICTYKKYGIIRYKDGEFISINSKAGLPSEKVRIALELQDGSIAVATNGGVAIIKDDVIVRKYTENNGFTNPVILCLTQDQSGRIYCGSDGNGIYLIDTDGSIKNYTVADGLPTDVILNLIHDARNNCIWISCGASLAVWDENGIRHLANYNGGTGSIFDIKLLENEAWLLATTSVTIAPYEYMLTGKGECTIFTKDDGVFEITSNSRHYISPDDTLYIATGNGVITIDTELFYTNLTAPKAIINSVTIDHETVINNPEDTVIIDSNVNSISFDFAALGYVPGKYMLQYQLVGMDKSPITVDASQLHSRDYTNLRGGTYTFRISVVSPAGVRNEQDVSLTIKKTLSFFEHPLGILLTVIICAAALAVMVQFYLKNKTERLRARQERYHSITESALRTIAKTIDAKDSYTNGHSYRVAQYSRELAERMGWKGDDLENLYYTALVHDIGKIGVPDRILTKKGHLDSDEYKTIQQHPSIGYEILKEFSDIPNISVGAKYHHERYDGTGYVDGLKGENIPLVSRIIAVADAYDAMSTPRVYRDALSEEEIIREIKEGAGSQFDPYVSEILLEMIADGIKFE